MDRRRAAGALLALAALIACATAAPTASNQTALDLYDSDVSEGCYYNFQHYGEGDRIMTNEPCLNCTCHNRMLMCYLRVCPFTKPIGQNCTNEKRADQCCPIVTCPDVPVDLLTSTSTTSPAEYGPTGVGRLDKYGCSINGRYLPEGSKVPSSPDKPCEHCYCIRNMTTCVMQECTLHVDGCTPIYLKDTCCPVRYSCDHPEDELPMLDDMTTTVRPTPGFLLTTTTMPSVTQIPQNCVHDDKIFADGALIKTEKACEHCYCMKGDIVCVVQECGTPMENEGKNCTSLPPRVGQCCPDTYICEGDNELQIDEITTNPPRKSIEGSGYRHDDEPYTQQPIEHEGSGFEDSSVEGSGEELTVKPIDTKDSETTPAPVVIGDTDTYATTSTSFYSSEKSSTELDKGYNTVPDNEEVTTQEAMNKIEEKTESSTTSPLLTLLPDITSTSEASHVSVTANYVPEIQEQKTEHPESEATSETDFSTDSTPKYSETQSTIISFDDKESKSTTVQLPNKTQVSEESSKTTTPSLDDNYTVIGSGTTVQLETNEQTTTEKVEYSETTSINPVDNEIHEDGPPKISPGIIPGEGNCLVDGLTYDNDTIVPSNDKCKTNCKCTSSIVKCDPIICSEPPDDMVNCKPIYDTLETCCPTYVCDQGKVTIPPQPHSQMSGTEIPVTYDCKDENCKPHDGLLPPAECGSTGCGDDHSQLPIKPDTQQPEVCLDGKCTSSSDGCNGDGCQLPTRKNEPCDQEGGCGLPEQPCIGTNCITPPKEIPQKCDSKEGCEEGTIPIQTCEGEACEHMSSEQPHDDSNKPKEQLCTDGTNCKTETNISGETQKECNDELCTKKQQNELGNKYDTECDDASCLPQEPVHPIEDAIEMKTETPAEPSITGIPEIVTKLPEYAESKLTELTEPPTESSVTEPQEKTTSDITSEVPLVTMHDQVTPTSVAPELEKITKLPEQPSPTEKQDMITEVPEKSGEPQEKTTEETDTPNEVPVTESQDRTTDVQVPEESLATEKHDLATEVPVEPVKSHEKATEIPIEVPVTESQDRVTDAYSPEEPSATEKQNIATEVPAEPVKSQETATEVSEIPVDMFVTEAQDKMTDSYIPEEPSVTEKKEIATEAPVELIEPHETPVDVPVTESQDKVTDAHASDVPFITEEQDMATEAPAEPVEPQEKATEVPETLVEVPVTESKERITDLNISEEPSATEKQDMETEAPDVPVKSDEKATEVTEIPAEVPITETITVTHALDEPSATEKQDMTTDAPVEPVGPHEKITEVPEIPVEAPVTESQDIITHVHGPEVPPATEKIDIVTQTEPVESQENATEVPEVPKEAPVTELHELITDAQAPEIPSATEKHDMATEAHAEPVEPLEKATQIPETTVKVPVTESQEKITDEHAFEESSTTEKQEIATELSKIPVVLQETETEVPEIPVEVPVTEPQERLTDINVPEEPSATEKQDVVTDAPIVPIEPHEPTTNVPEIPVEVSVTESQERTTDANAPEESTATHKQDISSDITVEPVMPQEKATEIPKTPVEVPVTESQERITELNAPEEPSSTGKQAIVTDVPEPSLTEKQGMATESPEIFVEVPVTESEEKTTEAHALEESSSTEKQAMTTDAPEESDKPHEKATEVPEKPVEAPVTESQDKMTDSNIPTEPSVTEKQEIATEVPVELIEPHEKVTVVPETPVDVPVTKSQDRVTDAPASDVPFITEKQDMATEAPVEPVEPQEKATEVPETLVEVPVTEIEEKVTDQHIFEEPLATEKQDMATEAPTHTVEPQEKATEVPDITAEITVTESQERITDAHIPEDASATEKQDMTTVIPAGLEPVEHHEKATDVPEIPYDSPVTEYQEGITNTHAPEEPSVTDKQDMSTEVPSEPLKPHEKVTDVPKVTYETTVTEAQSIPVTIEKLPDTKPEDDKKMIDDTEQSPATEFNDKITDVPDREIQASTEATITKEQDMKSGEPQTSQTLTPTIITEEDTFTKAPEMPPTGDQVKHTTISEEAVTVKHVTDSHASEEPPTTEKHDLTTDEPAESVKPQKKATKLPEIPVTESNEKTTDAHVTEESVTEKQDMETDAPVEPVEAHEKVSEVPEIPIEASVTESQEKVTEVHTPEVPSATEKQDISTKALEEQIEPQEKTTSIPEAPHEAPVTELPQGITDSPDSKAPSATEKEDMATELPTLPAGLQEKPTEIAEVPEEVPVTESHEISTDAYAPEVPSATEKQDMETPVGPVELQEKATEVPQTLAEVPVTEPQEKITDAHVSEEPSATEKEEIVTEVPLKPVDAAEKTTDVPEVPIEVPVTESQEKITDTHTPEQPLITDKMTETQSTNEPLVTEPYLKASESPEISTESPVTDSQVPEEPTKSPATESVENITDERATEVSQQTHEPEGYESPTDIPITEPQDLTVTKYQEKTPSPVTDEPKLEFSETTPYLVELEEHTHKIEREGSSTASDDRITAAPALPEGFVTEETEKPFSEEPETTEKIPADTEKYTTVSSKYRPEESSSSAVPTITDEEMISLSSTTSKTEDVTIPSMLDKFTKPESKPSDTSVTELPKTTISQLNDDLPLPDFETGSFPPTGSSGYGQEPDYGEEDQAFGPGTCRYGGKVYVSAQQIPRDDPCDFCFCFRSDIICLQQSCPPPIHGCHEEPIQGFCCPRYECPVSMATTLNVTTTTTTTTTTLPPHFLTHAYKGQAQKRGCQIKGQTYKVGEVVRASSGPCLHCTCGGDGQMKCDPKVCTPEPMLRQMIAAAVSSKRRR